MSDLKYFEGLFSKAKIEHSHRSFKTGSQILVKDDGIEVVYYFGKDGNFEGLFHQKGGRVCQT